MKIAYLISHDITKNDGVTKKIQGQIREWERQGNEVVIYCLTNVDSCYSSSTNLKLYKYKNQLDLRLKLQVDLLEDMNNFNPDIVYFRYDLWSITLSKILNKYKVIIELNTFDLGEMFLLLKQQKTFKSLFRFLIVNFFRSKVLSKVSGIIAVTKEIAEHKTTTKFNKPCIYLPNGIELKEYPTIKKKNNISEKVSLFFIGSPNQSWHGVDIIEKLSEKLPQYNFHIVGISGINKKNLFFYNYLEKNEYLEILKTCQICIGTLALHRNKMNEACPLKVREYLSYGYPILLGYEDTAFIDKSLPEWILKINTKKELDLTEIVSFIEKNKNFIVENDLIHFIDTKEIEAKRIGFFKKISKI